MLMVLQESLADVVLAQSRNVGNDPHLALFAPQVQGRTDDRQLGIDGPRLGLSAALAVPFRIPERINGSLVGGLRVGQVDLIKRLIDLNPGETKNDDARTVVMTEQVFQLLSACCAGKQPTDYVFTRNGRPMLDFSKTWKLCCERAGVPGLLFHDLRRTGRRLMALAGIEPSVAMKIGGWRTDSVAKRYCIVAQDMMQDATRKLEAQSRQRQQMWHSYGTNAPAIQTPPQSLQ